MPVIPTNQPLQPQNPTGQPEGRRERGTGFTNISRLLGANAGAGQIMGQNLGGRIGNKAGQLTADVTKAGADFASRSEDGKSKATTDIGNVSGVINNPGNLSGLTEEEARRLHEGLTGATYTGPTGLEGADQFAARGTGLLGLSNLASSGTMGQGMLLRANAAKHSPYSRGQGTLDQFLLGQSPEAQQAIRQGAQQAYGAEQQAGIASNVAEQQAKQYASDIEQQKANVTKDILSNISGMQTQGQEAAKQYLSEADRVKNFLTGNLPQDQLTDEDRKALSDLSQYGLGKVEYTGGDEDLNASILKSLANSMNTTYSGQYKYTPEQQKAAKNLALISGQPDLGAAIQNTDFSTQLLGKGADAAKSVASTSEQAFQDLQKSLGFTKSEDTQARINELTHAINSRDVSTGKRNSQEGPYEIALRDLYNPETFYGQAGKILGIDAVKKIMGDTREQTGIDNAFGASEEYNESITRNNIQEALRNVLNPVQQLNTMFLNRTNLQDYINQKFGIGMNTPITQGPRITTNPTRR